jgi:hypothetical protein
MCTVTAPLPAAVALSGNETPLRALLASVSVLVASLPTASGPSAAIDT